MEKRKTEKKFLEDYLSEGLDKRNIYHEKGNAKGYRGKPDRIVYGDEIYYVELKLGKENKSYYERTPLQIKWAKQIEQTSSRYFLLKTREEIDEFIALVHDNCVRKKIKNYFAYKKDII